MSHFLPKHAQKQVLLILNEYVMLETASHVYFQTEFWHNRSTTLVQFPKRVKPMK